MTQDETPRIGSICKDGGTCHHSCSPSKGCFRSQCCSPLSGSGLDKHWRTPQEAALAERSALDASTPEGAKSCSPSL